MNISKKGINTTTVALTIVLIVVIVAAVAYIAVSPGKTNTVTQTTTKTSTATSVSTSISTSVTTATSALPTYYPMTLQANGGTFVNPLMQTWAQGFQLYTDSQVMLNYQAIGTGAAQTDILTNIGAFAGGDAPISASQLASYATQDAGLGTLLQLPESLGGVAIFYNIPNVAVSLNLTGSILAKIYLGNITYWDASAIASLNPGCSYTGHTGSLPPNKASAPSGATKWCTLPHDIITPVHRSDGSGTTYALTNYFEKVSANWNASWTNGVITTVGCPCYGTSVAFPSSIGTAAKGSSGVAAYVLGNQYSMGYADSVYALNSGLQAAAIQNQAGFFVTPTVTDIAAAASAFSAQVLANPTFTITNAPGAGSYPISTYTYLYVWANQVNYQQGYDVAQLFEWIVSQGQAFAPSLNYGALPASVVIVDQSIIHQMNYNGVSFTPA